MEDKPLRMGILGAARIAPMALVSPARRHPQVRVDAVAARSLDRAQAFATARSIPHAYGSYDEVLADPEIDAVYVALPNSLHLLWSLRALAAGKHVLCEKPITSNADEARVLAHAAERSGLVVAEAMHSLYHPMVLRMAEVVASGELGRIQRVEGLFRTPMFRSEDIRFHYALGGGSLMDQGCYLVALLRLVAGDAMEVERAEATVFDLPGEAEVDRRMQATLQTPAGVTLTLDTEFRGRLMPQMAVRVFGERGSLTAVNPFVPHVYHHLKVLSGGTRRMERHGNESSYGYQLVAFERAVRAGLPMRTSAAYAVRSMEIIDAIYHAAGLRLRGA